MKRYCFALDLQDDPKMIAEYEAWHTKIIPEIRESITSSGIVVMDIFRAGDRMFMIMETEDHFDLEEKAAKDAASPAVQAWEKLMWKYQKPLPFAKPGEKWVMMKQIYQL